MQANLGTVPAFQPCPPSGFFIQLPAYGRASQLSCQSTLLEQLVGDRQAQGPADKLREGQSAAPALQAQRLLTRCGHHMRLLDLMPPVSAALQPASWPPPRPQHLPLGSQGQRTAAWR